MKEQNKPRHNLPQRLLALVLALVCVFCSNLEASALIISNGTASSGGSGNSASSGSGSYGLPAFVNANYNKVRHIGLA